MVTKRFAGRAYTVLWYGTVSTIIVAAVLMSLARVLLPFADDYRGRVERWVSAQLGEPVRIEAMNVRLRGTSPTLIFSGVHLVDNGGSVARFGELQFGFDAFASARRLQPVLDAVIIRGASLSIERLRSGQFRVSGVALDGPSGDSGETPVSMGAMLSSQPAVIIRDSNLTWRDHRRGGESFTFEGVAIELNNRGDRHRLNAEFRLPEKLGGPVRLAVDLEGDLLRPDLGRGTLHVSAEGWRPGPWLKVLPKSEVEILGGEADVSLWADWQADETLSVRGELSARDLELSWASGSERFDRISGNVGWRRDGRSWGLELSDMDMERTGSTWNDIRIQASGSTDGEEFELKANRLVLADVAALAGAWPGLDEATRRKLQKASPTGQLTAVRLSRKTGELSFQAEGLDLGMAPVDKLPGFSGVDGRLVFHAGRGELQLDSRAARIEVPKLFRNPIALDRVEGNVKFSLEGQSWRVSSPQLQLSNRDIKAQVGLTLASTGSDSPLLDLRGHFQDVSADRVASYLPVGIMSPTSVRWLDHAFRTGYVPEGSFLLHGRAADFPFRRGDGRFQVTFNAEQVQLNYKPGWPVARGLAGRVDIDGSSLRVSATRGRILNTRVKKAEVRIPDLRRPVLALDGVADGTLPDLLAYLRQSVLAGVDTQALDRFTTGGSARLQLELRQPLSDRVPGKASVEGSVALADASLDVAKGVSLEKLTGSLRFDGARISAQGIEGRLLGGPMRLDVQTQGWGEALTTEIALQGTVEGGKLVQLADVPALARFQGNTGWHGKLVLPHRAISADTVLRLNSDLEGLESSLPAPFAKQAEAREALKAVFFPGAGRGELVWERRLGVIFELAPGGGLKRAAVNFNGEVRELPAEESVRVTGSLDGLSPAAWRGLAGGSGGAGAVPLPPIHLDMDRVRLVEGEIENSDPAPSTPGRLPPLSVQVNALTYGDMALGRVAFRGEPAEGKFALRDLTIRSRHLQVEGAGDWTYAAGPGKTELRLTFRSDDLGAAMRDLRVASVIRDGDGTAKLKLSWPGGPGAFETGNLNGSLRLDIKDGRIDDIEPGAGRLLGLLSLQALHRRLLLDFRDIFGKGTRFEDIKGDIRLVDGNAYTDNLRLDALPASVFTTGRTGLADRDFDHMVTVVPQVSGTLPVAGGLALGPQVGAVLLLFQQLLGDRIDEGSSFQYKVTGSWDEPVVDRVALPPEEPLSSAAEFQ